MSNGRIVVQITIVVNDQGQTVLKTLIGEDEGGTARTETGGPSANRTAGTLAALGSGGASAGRRGEHTARALRGKAAAQRTVHVVAGIGGLAWFTTIWPTPIVVTHFQQQFALDDPAKVMQVPGTSADHPLYARKIGERYLWQAPGMDSEPTIFVAGTNQAHSEFPKTTILADAIDVVAAGAALQAGLGATIPALSFKSGLVFGPAAGAPPIKAVVGIAGAITALKEIVLLTAEDEQDLAPSAAQLARCGVDGSTHHLLVNFANLLLFTANAFRRNFLGTVLLPAFNDDPHGAFAGGSELVAGRSKSLAAILDGFYAEMAAHPEPTAEDGPLSLAENVVLIVSGDTPKNPFDRNGWSDATPNQSNLIYVRSNGYLQPGWFGSLTPSVGRTNFDPTSGVATSAAQPAPANAAALLGVLFAISRGDGDAVGAVSQAPFNGVVATCLP